MKILLVTHAYPPEAIGGTERYVQLAAEGLAAVGHRVRVLTGSLVWEPTFRVERTEAGGIEVIRVHRSDLYFDHWDKGSNPRVAEVFEQQLDDFAPDVVHLHHWIRLSADFVRRAAHRGIPSVVHLHDLYSTCPRVFRRNREDESCALLMGPETCLRCVPRWKFQADAEIAASLRHYEDEVLAELRYAAARIAPSSSHAATLQQYWGEPSPGPIEVLAHPLMPTTEAIDPAAVRRAESPAGRLVVLYFSMLHPIKGAHVLLEALGELGPGHGIRVELVGAFATEDYERHLRDLARGHDVEFHGAYQPGEQTRHAADVIAIPSLAKESYSFWLDEAYRMGLPIVASRTGALEARATGRVASFPAGDARALADRLRELRDNLELRARLGASAADEPMEREVHLDRLQDVFRAAILEGVRPVEPPPAQPATLKYDWDRREAGFAELLRSEGWEDVIHRLEERLRASDEHKRD
jgi:glycosyltransferase involved in cell wall biosynthesis